MFTNNNKIYYALRFAAAMCFIGHGTFGIITKQVWCNYFAVFGIGHQMAYTLMPILGSVDILFGLSILFYPTRFVLLWLAVWGVITATLRPMSGEPFAELIERAGNFGAPMALLLLCGIEQNISSWFRRLDPPAISRADRQKKVGVFLQCIAFLLLTGHGWANLVDKKGLLSQYSSLGFHDTHQAALIAGLIEVAMGVMILIKPLRSFVFVFLVWKMGSELFYPHWELFEWIERGGSYGVLLALWFSLGAKTTAGSSSEFYSGHSLA
jgi:hypothetical protein